MKWLKRLLRFSLLLIVLNYSCRVVNPIRRSMENKKESISTGESWKGKLQNGKFLPNKGKNFETVSYVFTALGRNAVNNHVRDLMLEVYDSLYRMNPEWKYKYGETGWRKGGKFWPHYTHQNGLVVDFMVPLLDKKDRPVTSRTNIFNRWGYALEFDTNASVKKYSIDFESMAAHLYMLKKLGAKHGLKIRRIIFEPEFLPKLYAAKYGKKIKDIEFVYQKHWIRHDDHYHTEFSVLKK